MKRLNGNVTGVLFMLAPFAMMQIIYMPEVILGYIVAIALLAWGMILWWQSEYRSTEAQSASRLEVARISVGLALFMAVLPFI